MQLLDRKRRINVRRAQQIAEKGTYVLTLQHEAQRTRGRDGAAEGEGRRGSVRNSSSPTKRSSTPHSLSPPR